MKKITFYKQIYKRHRLKRNVPNCSSVNLNVGYLLRVITTLDLELLFYLITTILIQFNPRRFGEPRNLPTYMIQYIYVSVYYDEARSTLRLMGSVYGTAGFT
jgi:hypothetical protein